MTPLLALLRKDIKLLLADRFALAMTFAMPLILIVLFGFVFGGAGGRSARITIIGIDHSQSPLSGKIMKALEAEQSLRVLRTYTVEDQPGVQIPFTDSVAAQWVRTGRVTAALIIPQDAISDTGAGLKLTLLYDARNEMETGLLQGVLQQTIMTKVPGMFITLMQQSASNYLGKTLGTDFNRNIQSVVKQYFGGKDSGAGMTLPGADSAGIAGDTAAENATSSFFSNLIRFDEQQLVGKQLANPGVTRSIGGWALMFALFSLTAASRSLIEEREEGTLHRLLSSPIPRSTILLAKFLFAWLLGIVQLVVLFILGSVIFSVPILHNAGNLLLTIVLSSAAATSFGMLIAAFARTSAQANGISTILILSMSALGGSWFPVSLMPPFIQTLSKFTLTYWAVDGFLSVLYRDLPLPQLLPNLGILAGIAVVMMTAGVWRFRSRETL